MSCFPGSRILQKSKGSETGSDKGSGQWLVVSGERQPFVSAFNVDASTWEEM